MMTGTTFADPQIIRSITEQLGVREGQVKAACEFLDAGATVPFIARYRKERTGSLDDAQLRTIQERLLYLRDLEAKRASVLDSLTRKKALGESLRAAVLAAATKSELNALYAPYKSARRTHAQIAYEAGLEDLVEDLLQVPLAGLNDIASAYIHEPEEEAAPDTGVPDAASALAGARAIIMDRAAHDHDLMSTLHEKLWNTGIISARLVPGQEEAGAKFSDYFAFSEHIRRIPSHRVLALLRAEKAGAVKVSIDVAQPAPALSKLSGEARTKAQRQADAYEHARASFEAQVAIDLGIPVQVLNIVSDDDDRVLSWLATTVRTTWRQRLLPRLASDIRTELFEKAQQDAIAVFASNLRDVLLAAPAGTRTVLGLDPGLRTGVKLAVVDGTGKVLETGAIYPHAPHHKLEEALITLQSLCQRHAVELIAIGNGTASRETDRMVATLISRCAAQNLRLQKVVVSEAGASVYSASERASDELADLDVTVRGAVSIARRLQDPLAELVKIDPKSIGVGQYQHDVPETLLEQALTHVVEDCVNAVGVWVNSASAALLARVAGLNKTTAENIVAYRHEHGPFSRREQLLDVPRLGVKAFEQAAGFIRIADGDEPLDASAVHPEAYDLARDIVKDAGGLQGTAVPATRLLELEPADYVTDRFGLPTVRDIFAELAQPGRDPRPAFKTAKYADGVENISDVRPGMLLEGTVSNVAAFGAFVDIGVHQDGLIHLSAMSRDYVKDPHDIVRSGDVVTVRVLEVDPQRKRISLTLLVDEKADVRPSSHRGGKRKR
ncbi:Tex family protein [Rothia sp. ZJ1223]|uniref:Tex family protein n=1 Tax=Rothia sp. ZJ1223 TaxID=2811098 RepID=UPI00195CB4B6|nr:Tex family protein [Rothia sp. ZJ1223]MBM7051493.1 RNA-binding transcriptional accessory protein [Rothia sp. ZJ1223]